MHYQLSKEDQLARTWSDYTNVVRDFLGIRPRYEQLCEEVSYILNRRLGEAGIEISGITYRAKTLNSFLEKLSRKSYQEPLNDVTDISGARVVYLYRSDRRAIEALLEQEFDVIEKVDKFDQQDDEGFGYDALYYLVKLKPGSVGARYSDLQGLVCEVQVRTVLQDAWSTIDYHLVYKQESGIPKALKRKLSTFAALFENADDQLDQIRREREAYKADVKAKMENDATFLGLELNLDTLIAYLDWRFDELDVSDVEDSPFYAELLQDVLRGLRRLERKTLGELNELLKNTDKASQAMSKQLEPSDPIEMLIFAIALADESFRQQMFSDHEVEIIERYVDYVELAKS